LRTVTEENRTLAKREKTRAEVLGCDAYDVGMLAKRPIIEHGEISDAALRAGADRGGPEDTVLAKL
jgi:hypothetical protein